jgi:ribosomal protein L11 methyltransferase
VPWLALSLELDPPQAEALSEALMETGAESVSLDPAGARMCLTALAPQDADPAALIGAAAQLAGLPVPSYSTARVEDEDWVRRSQAQFVPIRISDAFWIVPSWHTPPAGATLAIRLDPGLAFGTGSHPTTRLILQRLEGLLQAGTSVPRVLDYGCGSGILAIAAAKLGAQDVAATDIDPQAVEATAANAKANGVQMHVALPDALPAGNYDLVLANILAGPLIALAPLLASRTRPGGRVLLSGILRSQADDVAAAYAPDFAASVTGVEEDWVLVEGLRR